MGIVRSRPPAAARALVALLLLLAACSGTKTLSLEQLAFEPDGFDGDQVRTTGVVVEFDADDGALIRHYVIQDASQNRVQLLPDDEAAPYVGRVVTVVGTFRFDETQGRRLEIDTIEAASERSG